MDELNFYKDYSDYVAEILNAENIKRIYKLTSFVTTYQQWL